MKVLVTGANGFIGKNLVLRLRERADTEVLTLMRGDGDGAFVDLIVSDPDHAFGGGLFFM